MANKKKKNKINKFQVARHRTRTRKDTVSEKDGVREGRRGN